MKDLLKVGQVLDRSDMKKIMAGSGDGYGCWTCCKHATENEIYVDCRGTYPDRNSCSGERPVAKETGC